jgi:hypothetical protein
MPSKEHIQLGWAVRWVLSTPPGPPRLGGRCVRVVPVLPLLLCTRPARALSAFGWGVKAQLPLRSSSRGVLPGPGALAGYRHSKFARWLIETAVGSGLQNEIGTFVLLRSLHTRDRDPVWHKRMNRVDQLTRVLSDTASFVTQRSPALELLRERGYTAPRDTSLTESMFGPVSGDTSLSMRVDVRRTQARRLRSTSVRPLFPITLSGDLNSPISQV